MTRSLVNSANADLAAGTWDRDLDHVKTLDDDNSLKLSDLGTRLRDAMRQMRFKSWRQASVYLGLPPTHLRRIAVTGNCEVAVLQKLHQTFGIHLDWLLCGEGSIGNDKFREMATRAAVEVARDIERRALQRRTSEESPSGTHKALKKTTNPAKK